MLIVPLTHDRNVARRWPWITSVILLLNVAALFGFLLPDRRVATEIGQRVEHALEYYSEHPGLVPSARLLALVPELFEELRAEQSSEIVPPPLRLRLARQYRHRGDAERAALAFAEVHSGVERSEYSLPALLGHAELALELGSTDTARQLYERARSFVSTDVQLEAAIRQGLARTLQASPPARLAALASLAHRPSQASRRSSIPPPA